MSAVKEPLDFSRLWFALVLASLLQNETAAPDNIQPFEVDMKAGGHKKGERGFTLVEVLIAMTILAIGLLAISQMQITALQATSLAHNVSATNNLASGVLESILAWDKDNPGFDNLKSDGTYDWDFDPLAAGVQNTVSVAGAGTFTASYRVDADSPQTGMATITVTVRSGGVSGLLQGSGQRQRTLIGQRGTK